MKHQIGRDWDPVTTSLLDYRRRARTREALTHATLIGIGAAFIGFGIAVALGLAACLRYVFGFIAPHLPAVAWAIPAPRSTVEAVTVILTHLV